MIEWRQEQDNRAGPTRLEASRHAWQRQVRPVAAGAREGICERALTASERSLTDPYERVEWTTIGHCVQIVSLAI